MAESTAKLESVNLAASKPKFFDIEVVDVEPTTGVLSFHLLDSATTQNFAQFKQAFQQFHSQMPVHLNLLLMTCHLIWLNL